MNQRIRELAEHCWEESQSQPAWFNQEKFALLIVRECAGVVGTAVDQREPASTYVGKIKQHFGVEESKGWVCPKCGTDRTKAVCPQGPSATVDGRCPMVISAQ